MNFNDGKYLKAKDKENIYKALERFIKSDFDPSKFTKALYSHLMLHFNFIAHTNQNGFFENRFEDPDGRMQTFKQIDEASPWEFRDDNTSGTADLNKAIQDLVRTNKSKFLDTAVTKKIEMLREQHKKIGDELERLTGLKKVTSSKYRVVTALDQGTKKIKVKDIKVGDLVDLESCPHIDRKKHPEIEFEFSEVIEIEKETPHCTVLYFDNATVAYDPEQVLEVKRKK